MDYKQCHNTQELEAAVREVAPEGVDMYFENVGGMHFEAACALLRSRGRIAVCGRVRKKLRILTVTDRLHRITTGLLHQWRLIQGS